MLAYEFCKVVEIGRQPTGEVIFGVVDTRSPNVGKPYTWGDKKTAERAYAEQVMFVPYTEYRRMKKTGYTSAYKARMA